MAKHKNIGSSFDVFLEEDGILRGITAGLRGSMIKPPCPRCCGRPEIDLTEQQVVWSARQVSIHYGGIVTPAVSSAGGAFHFRHDFLGVCSTPMFASAIYILAMADFYNPNGEFIILD